MKDIAKRDNDNIPKYVFFLMDDGESEKLKKVLIYDYFDIYPNDSTKMNQIMSIINKSIIYIQFGLSIACIFGGAMCVVQAIINFGADIYWGVRGTVSIDNFSMSNWMLYTLQIGTGIFLWIVAVGVVTYAKYIDKDTYTVKEKKIKKMISKKIKIYDKKSKKYFI